MTQFTTYLYAGPDERFAEDCQFPVGEELRVKLPHGVNVLGTILAAEVLDDGARVKLVIETDLEIQVQVESHQMPRARTG